MQPINPLFDSMEAQVHGNVDQQLFSCLFRLPAELRLQVFEWVMPSEITLSNPADLSPYHHTCSEAVEGITMSCKRAMYELSKVPRPRLNLRLPLLDAKAKANAVLEVFRPRILPAIKTIIIQSPSWVVRPDRFQYSSDQESLRFDMVNRFLDRCVNMELLVIEVNGHSFSGLVNASLRQLEPLKIRRGVEVEIKVSKGSSSNRAMGPTSDTIEEVIAAIKGNTSIGVPSGSMLA